MKNLQILSKNFRNVDSMLNLRNYIRKKVFSSSGQYVGKVKDVYFQGSTLNGVLVKGKISLFVDKEYISSDTGESVMLSIEPVTSIMGKQVFDADGRNLGKVIALERKTNANSYVSLIIKRGLFRKNQVIPKEHIQVCSDNIILNKIYE
ncbi:MAG: PRC-barrel domain-containing protein [Candidatus Woesearchaeota archaeon]